MASSIARFRGPSALLIGAAVVVVVAISSAATARGASIYPCQRESVHKTLRPTISAKVMCAFSRTGSGGDQIHATGRIKAAFDACQRCYMYHKGYVSSRGGLLCRFFG
jgi:hypothetical protein